MMFEKALNSVFIKERIGDEFNRRIIDLMNVSQSNDLVISRSNGVLMGIWLLLYM